MALINVDPNKQGEAGYRYKMPPIQTKVEGAGNGIKTVIVNAESLAKVLVRNVEYLLRFLGIELAAASKYEDQKWILTGRFEQDNVQQKVFDFIKRFVMCKSCRNPETDLFVDEKKNTLLRCKGCGHTNSVDPSEKLIKIILKTEKPRAADVSKKQKKREKTKDMKQHDEWAEQTRFASEADDFAQTQEDPVQALRRFMGEDAPSDVLTYQKVMDLKANYGLSDKNLVQLVFEASFDENIHADKQIAQKKSILERFLKDDACQKVVIEELMAFCLEYKDEEDEKKAGLYKRFPIFLKEFYDEGVLSEEVVLKWHESKPTSKLGKKLPKEAQAQFRAIAQPVIDWLKDNDDSDEEEEDEEESGNDEE